MKNIKDLFIFGLMLKSNTYFFDQLKFEIIIN
jgi:hypothetical protein